MAIFDTFVSFKIAEFTNFDVIKFIYSEPEELQISARNHNVDLHKVSFPSRLYQFSSSNSRFVMIFSSLKFSMNFCKSNQNAAILKIIKISQNTPLRLTASFWKIFKIRSYEILKTKFGFSTQTLV